MVAVISIILALYSPILKGRGGWRILPSHSVLEALSHGLPSCLCIRNNNIDSDPSMDAVWSLACWNELFTEWVKDIQDMGIDSRTSNFGHDYSKEDIDDLDQHGIANHHWPQQLLGLEIHRTRLPMDHLGCGHWRWHDLDHAMEGSRHVRLDQDNDGRLVRLSPLNLNKDKILC